MALQGHVRRKSYKGGIEGLKKRTKPAVVKVGILSGAGEHNKGEAGQTLAEIGWWMEFGTATIPPRPVLRSTIKRKDKDYKTLMRRLIRRMLLGKVKPQNAQAILGLLVQRDIQKTITDLKTPPNAQATIDAKGGKSNPLIDTGQFRQTISWQALVL